MSESEQRAKQYLRMCLERARAWRTREGLSPYDQYYWTPKLARTMQDRWLTEAMRTRRYLMHPIRRS